MQSFCESRDWKFCFIGGLAVQHWSEMRTTMDVDMTLLTGFGNEAPFLEELFRHFTARRSDAWDLAETRRVALVQTADGIGIDIALGALPFETKSIERSRKVEMLPGHFIRLCTAEDLIVHKVFAARSKDWRDVEMTIVRQGDENLDWALIRRELKPLLELKETPDLLDRLEALRREVTRTRGS